MERLIEVDIYYLTGHRIEGVPARNKMTLRFVDWNNTLSGLHSRLQTLRRRESALILDLPAMSGFSQSFSNWRLSTLTNKIARLEEKIERKAESRLRFELQYTNLVKTLARIDGDTSAFEPLDRARRRQILAIFTDDQRLLDPDWVTIHIKDLDLSAERIEGLA